MIVIGEKINGTRPEVAQAIKDRDAGFIKSLALMQVECGADILDVNAGTHPDQEPDDLAWLVTAIQEATDARLALDSTNPQALSAGIAAAKALPMINSLSGEAARIEGVLPLACEHGAELVVLALDDQGIPRDAEERLEIVRRLIELTRAGGLDDSKLYVDPLVTTIATDNNSGLLAFLTMRRIKVAFPRVHLTCGLSNISFGQPSRSTINQAFAALAISAGLDSAIIDPCDHRLRGVIHAAEMVLGKDPDCQRYAQAHRKGLLGHAAGISPESVDEINRSLGALVASLDRAGLIQDGQLPGAADPKAADTGEQPKPEDAASADDRMKELVDALVNMKKDRVAELTDQLLNGGTDPLAVLDASRQGMAEVGRLFEEEEYFVPELILAGRMLAAIADKAKPFLSGGDLPQEKKGRVLIGTVEGDIHDIGKDIVVTMLEINGYEVMDLGVDVPKERFLEAAQEFKPDVIGLSGFLTLVYDPMKETIAELKQLDLGEVKFMIGGGQMDEQVRRYTEADAFGRDAMEAVKICQQWLG